MHITLVQNEKKFPAKLENSIAVLMQKKGDKKRIPNCTDRTPSKVIHQYERGYMETTEEQA